MNLLATVMKYCLQHHDSQHHCSRHLTGMMSTACVVMLALVACAGTPVKNTQLDLARDTLERVSADPEVARYSKDELNIASASFASAEKA